MGKIEELIEEGISCLIPIYQGEIGNVTKIITDKGNIHIDERTIKTVLRALCQHYTIQVELSRAKYGKLLHQRLAIPIPIHSNLLLIPMKMRKPLFSKDGAYGYVNLHAIESIKEKESSTWIQLKNGAQVLCLHTIRTVRQHMHKAKAIQGNGMNYGQESLEEERFKEFCQQYASPATKGDIAFLQQEISALTDIFRKIIEVKKGNI